MNPLSVPPTSACAPRAAEGQPLAFVARAHQPPRHPDDAQQEPTGSLPLPPNNSEDLSPADEIQRLKNEVKILQQREQRTSERLGAAADEYRELGVRWENDRRELLAELGQERARRREAEIKVNLLNDRLNAATAAIERQHSIDLLVQQIRGVATRLYSCAEGLKITVPKCVISKASPEELFSVLERSIELIAKFGAEQRDRHERGKKQREQFEGEKTALQANHATELAALRAEIMPLHGLLQSLRGELDTERAKYRLELDRQKRRDTLLESLLTQQRQVSSHEHTLVPVLSADAVAQLLAIAPTQLLPKLAALEKEPTPTNGFLRALAENGEAQKHFAGALRRISARRDVLSENEETIGTKFFEEIDECYGVLLRLGARAVTAYGTIRPILCCSPELGGEILDRVPPEALLELVSHFLVAPSDDHALHASALLRFSDRLPAPTRACAALLAPSPELALSLLCGSNAIRAGVSKVRELCQRELTPSASAPAVKAQPEVKRTLIEAYSTLPEGAPLRRAKEALQALDFIPEPYLEGILSPFVGSQGGFANARAILGFDLGDVLLIHEAVRCGAAD